ncbi:MAG: peptidyl-prolyl cis-trans isomerase [Thiothrix sp.]|nr:peptidyl-prolyl cis-trans isomerase [Thiothrix sp.]HPE60292.1 peptidylprolyl isomerase [Thiolinea sp.]
MSDHPKVLLETSKGNITLELDAKAAPNTVQNFLSYVQDGFYDGTVFHRVIPGFMVQGGGMNADMSDKTTRAPIKNEAGNGLKNLRGTVAMARTNAPHSASSQFFINVADNDFLNFKNETPQGWGYAVFGKVAEGLDVVDGIVAVKTGNHGMHQNVPVEPVLINKATVVQ